MNRRRIQLQQLLLLAVCLAAGQVRLCFSQAKPSPPPPPPPSPPAALVDCNGIYLSYELQSRTKIHPFVSDASRQPYAFTAVATVQNNGLVPLVGWELAVFYQHGEILVSVSGAVLTDGGDMPYNTTLIDGVGNATLFSGYPNADLLTAIATAGDLSQIRAEIYIVGTLFAGPPPPDPNPSAISLAAPSNYTCGTANVTGNVSTVCCVLNSTDGSSTLNTTQNYRPRLPGDLTIAYDVVESYQSSYLAQVTIENHAPLGRLDNWQLQWEWQRQEFISMMKGAYPLLVDPRDCIYGPQAQFYQSLAYSNFLNCQRKPVILDLPASSSGDPNLGNIPHCCRNGTLLPKRMANGTESKSEFILQVYKMPPDLNATKLYPPVNFKISSSSPLDPEFNCSQPLFVSPTLFPNPSGIESSTPAFASWQVVCNITQSAASKPKCCVSFSGFFNNSVVPCSTCACGCPANPSNKCSTTAPAMLLPPQAMLVPFDNRTAMAVSWAQVEHFSIPNPLPCGDYCGVSINWHIATDYPSGWSARITIFNWNTSAFADWFAAVVLGDKAYKGYQATYSFDGSQIGNDTIFMEGLPGLNYLVGEVNQSNPSSNPPLPGKQQTVISFTKSNTPGINVVGGDGYPLKVFFNGEECAMPTLLPTSRAFRTAAVSSMTFLTSVVLVMATTAFILLRQ